LPDGHRSRCRARIGLLDWPDGRRKSQAEPMPLLGGVAVYLSLLVTFHRPLGFHWEWLASDDRFVILLLVSGACFVPSDCG